MECKRLSSSLTSTTVVISNDDLLIQILLFLSARTLLRFKLINKQWNSIISGEHFRRLHTLYHRHWPKSLPHVILHSIRQQYHSFSPVAKTFFPLRFDFPYTYILHSCQGLLLLEYRYTQYGRSYYCVFNPTTNQYRKLSLNCDDNAKKTRSIAGLYLVFDLSKSVDYKVVCIWKTISTSQFRVEVYDPKNGQSSKMLGEPFSASRYTKFTNGIYWNGEIYWIRPTSTSYVLDLNSGTVGTPPTIKMTLRKVGQSNKNYVVESNGHMHCISVYSRQDTISLLIYEMNDSKSGWCEKYYADLNLFDAASDDVNCREQVNVLGIVRGEREEESAVLLHVPTKIICYRFCDGSFEVVLDLTKHKNIYGKFSEDMLLFERSSAWQFTESLTPV